MGDACPFCRGPSSENGAVNDDRRLLLRCLDGGCRGSHKWFPAVRQISKHDHVARRQIEEKRRLRAGR